MNVHGVYRPAANVLRHGKPGQGGKYQNALVFGIKYHRSLDVGIGGRTEYLRDRAGRTADDQFRDTPDNAV